MSSASYQTIVLAAHLAGAVNAGKRAYLERLDAQLRQRGYRLLLMDLAGRVLQTGCDCHPLPERIARGEGEILFPAEIPERLPGLEHAVAMDAGFYQLAPEAAAHRAFPAAIHIYETARREKAACVVLWHQFNGISMAAAALCASAGIGVIYAHLGVLPGTIVFERDGQMGESWVARENERFLRLPVSEADFLRARTYLARVRNTCADRKPQTLEWSIRERLAGHRAQGRKLIFYAGQNDYRTGMAPRDLPNALLHSPLFSSTREGLEALLEIARERNWAIVFKPHPNVEREYSDLAERREDRLETVAGANIFECLRETDVTATVVSAACYLALIHGRPAVLLGASPMSGKGCAYEIAARDEIGGTISKAVEEGVTATQAEAWERHAAQLLRHYLFAYDTQTAEEIGRDVDEAADFLLDACGGTGGR